MHFVFDTIRLTKNRFAVNHSFQQTRSPERRNEISPNLPRYYRLFDE